MKVFKRVLFLNLLLGVCQLQAQNKFIQTLSDNWQIQSAVKASKSGAEISQTKFKPLDWQSAKVPTTVLNALVLNGVYKDIYTGKNLESIPTDQFKGAWWYRTGFKIDNNKRHTRLELLGLNYRANVWLNGVKIADTAAIKNSFRQFKLEITQYLKKGDNILAIEVFPPQAGDFTMGFVDWNPEPPDKNMGIYRQVNLLFDEGVSLNKPFVQTKLDVQTLKAADLTISTELENNQGIDVSGVLEGTIGDVKFSKNVSLKAKEHKTVVLTAQDIRQLHFDNPRIWWPHTIGKPEMYNLQLSFVANNKISNTQSVDFGIRDVQTYRTPEGYQGYKINGQPFQIRGGGWVDDLLLGDTPDYIEAQLKYTKDMNLNTVRLEGFWGKDETIYSMCDRMGLLIMVGWSCQWEWEDYLGAKCDEKFGGILTEKDIDLVATAWEDQLIWLRNHPSIFVWMAGSDCIPKPELEEKYFKTFEQYDTTRAYLASAKEWVSLAGYTGVKMRGPYDYEPPVYWYADKKFGGAFGFNTETGPGAQVPPLESMKKMLPADKLWPINDVWDYHCGRHSFGKLDLYTKSLESRYGKVNSVEDYTFLGQIMNYELMRPMFEAFVANKNGNATGVIQWMLNSAWPEVYWQLYDTYLMPNGAYYGTKKACAPLSLLYHYSEKAIYLNNDKLEGIKGLQAQVRVLDTASNTLYNHTFSLDAAANTAFKVTNLPDFRKAGKMYFVDLRLVDANGKEVSNNFYWLSNKADELDYDAEVPGWYFHTPAKEYADLSSIRNVPATTVVSSMSSSEANGKTTVSVKLQNTGKNLALFVNPSIVGVKDGLSILPVIWTDNYVSLLPNETRVLEAYLDTKDLKGQNIELKLEGLNIIKK